MAIPKVMGTEIEYGITVKGDPDFDPISSCVLLVNAYREDHAGEILWDYDQENPLADARGFQQVVRRELDATGGARDADARVRQISANP